ncbi:leucine zipper domain-containing protein [Streptomyces anulatus]|uniref:leucine zipper domain-containing protein n=1 Tax=Streptomyces anulatus TaxID=1892 RepID=UPI00403D8CA5
MVEVSNLHHTEAFVSHRNARLTVHGRRLLVDRVCRPSCCARRRGDGHLASHPAHKWLRRWRSEGESGIIDCSSRPRRTPHRSGSRGTVLGQVEPTVD